MPLFDDLKSPPVILAPMAGFSDAPMRIISKKYGATALFSEMLKSTPIVRKNNKTFGMAAFSELERPIIIQIAGRDPSEMAEAARSIMSINPDAIDINLGCPVKKILKEGAGAALLKEPDLVAKIIKNVRKAISIPLTIKIRLGWDGSLMTGKAIAKIAQEEGVSMVTVHGRTAVQMYTGKCSLEGIREVVESVDIPVIGNGDIASAEDAKRMMQRTGCRGVMIGRAAIGRPWLFGEISIKQKNGTAPIVDAREKIATMKEHLDLLIQYFGEERACRLWRKHAIRYVRGGPGAAILRDRIMRTTSSADHFKVIEDAYGRKE